MLCFRKPRLVSAAAMIVTLSIGITSQATASNYSGARAYQITVTNVTKAIQFTPILAATHKSSVGFFEAGSAPSDELAILAEGGNTEPLQTLLDGLDQVSATTTVGPLLAGGETRTFEIESNRKFRYLSLAAMLLPTNDSFMALDTVALPVWGSITRYARGYDAGSELNDELCTSIPGPTCGGSGEFDGIDSDAEGFVHISSGIHGIGDFGSAQYDWRDVVAKVTIKRIR